MKHWHPYSPRKSAPWDLKRVVHLHQRTTFGATAAEIHRDVADDPTSAIDRILNGTTRQNTPADFDSLSAVIGDAASDSPNPDRLKAWWIYRCLFTPDPLEERLTLMWHNHFATSNLKVDNLRLMKQQNETLRKHARLPFGDLLRAMAHDPALLIWLDAPANRKGHPNENLARELMELFSLGLGHFTETDVKEAARALTGWTVRNGRFEINERAHDSEPKNFLGHNGNWNGNDVIRIVLEHPATAERLARKITQEFFGEGVVSSEALQEAADHLRSNDLNIAKTVALLIHSDLFFSDANIRSRVCDPMSFLVGPARLFACFSRPPSTLILADWLRRMGQDLFYPPNVGGWNGGRNWLSTRTVIARTNYVSALISGRTHNPVQKPELDQHLTSLSEGNDLKQQINAVAELLGIRCSEATLDQIATSQNGQGNAASAITSLLSLPDIHLH